MAQSKKRKIELYGLEWPVGINPVAIEIAMIRRGGKWRQSKDDNRIVGKGLAFHFRRLQELLWPEKIWHKWNQLEMECFLNYRTVIEIGPASSGKTHSAATNVLADWFCWPECTTVLCCSTTRERLEERIWGEIKHHFTLAKRRCPWLPGHLIEGRQRIVSDPKTSDVEARDFRNGLVGVAAKRGETFIGIGEFAGIKNKRIRLIADELHLLPHAIIDGLSNLDKNPDFKFVGLGNPKDINDPLGILAEPAAHLGGWDGGIDQKPGTKTWEIKRPHGICIQLWGSDSPNLDGKLGAPLITKDAIDRDLEFYGRDSLWFHMMNEGRMPRGQGSRRVLTRQMCIKFGATKEPHWADNNRIKVGFLDAAYRAVGGDRCIFGELQFGIEASSDNSTFNVSSLISQSVHRPNTGQIIALIDYMVIPIKAVSDDPEDQIVEFVMEQCKNRNIPPENFFFDAGMRTSLVTAFARLWSNRVNPVDCGGKPSQDMVSAEIQVPCDQYYSKFITELWFSVRLAVEAGQVRGFTDEVIEEFCNREWTIVAGNKIEVEPKHKMKEKIGRSPDIADAIAVGFYGARKLGFVIRKLGNQQQLSTEQTWLRTLHEKSRQYWTSGQLTYQLN